MRVNCSRKQTESQVATSNYAGSVIVRYLKGNAIIKFWRVIPRYVRSNTTNRRATKVNSVETLQAVKTEQLDNFANDIAMYIG